MYDTATEWDYRAPTLAEQVDQLRASWDGPRCPHGTPLNAPGPDLICGACERDAEDELSMRELLDDLDAGLPYPFEIGPTRDTIDRDVLWGFRPRPVPTDDDLPF